MTKKQISKVAALELYEKRVAKIFKDQLIGSTKNVKVYTEHDHVIVTLDRRIPKALGIHARIRERMQELVGEHFAVGRLQRAADLDDDDGVCYMISTIFVPPAKGANA